MGRDYNNSIDDVVVQNPVYTPVDFLDRDDSGYSVIAETFNVPTSATYNGLFLSRLDQVPLQQSDFTCTINAIPATVQRFGDVVALGNVSVDFDRGIVEFNSGDAAKQAVFNYTGRGTYTSANIINQLNAEVEDMQKNPRVGLQLVTTAIPADQDILVYNTVGSTWENTDAETFLFGLDFVKNSDVSSTDNTVARFNGITGNLIQGSSVVIDDSNNMSGVVSSTSTTFIASSGSSASPGFQFTDTNNGMYLSNSDEVSISAGGVQNIIVKTNEIDLQQNVVVADGKTLRVINTSAPGPQIIFAVDAGSHTLTLLDTIGTFEFSSNLNVTGSLVAVGSVTGTGVLTNAGSAAAPSFRFSTDTNTGIYSSGADSISIATGGSSIADFSTTISLNGNTTIANSLASPTLSFFDGTDTGTIAFNASTNIFDVSVGINVTGTFVSSGSVTGAGVLTNAGSAATPSFRFSTDTNTGIYGGAADQINFSTGGTSRAYITTSAIQTTVDILPTATGTLGLGSTSFRFDTFYGEYLNLSTNSIDSLVNIERLSTANPATSTSVIMNLNNDHAFLAGGNGFGAYINLQSKPSSGGEVDIVRLEWSTPNSNITTGTGEFAIYVANGAGWTPTNVASFHNSTSPTSPAIQFGTSAYGFYKSEPTVLSVATNGAEVWEYQTSLNKSLSQFEVEGTSNPIMILDQNTDSAVSFINFEGTTAASTAKPISTLDAGATGSATSGPSVGTWNHTGMLRIKVNGIDMWVPYYVEL